MLPDRLQRSKPLSRVKARRQHACHGYGILEFLITHPGIGFVNQLATTLAAHRFARSPPGYRSVKSQVRRIKTLQRLGEQISSSGSFTTLPGYGGPDNGNKG